MHNGLGCVLGTKRSLSAQPRRTETRADLDFISRQAASLGGSERPMPVLEGALSILSHSRNPTARGEPIAANARRLIGGFCRAGTAVFGFNQ
jgi:hypothetical protein